VGTVRSVRRLALTIGLSLLFACGKGTGPLGQDGGPQDSNKQSAAAKEADKLTRRVLVDFAQGGGACDLGRDGVVFDFGHVSARAAMLAGTSAPRGDDIEREGASWFRPKESSISLSFYSGVGSGDGEALYTSIRARGERSRAISASLNGKSLGSGTLGRDAAQITTFRSTQAQLLQGLNELSLRLSGSIKTESDVLAELDWLTVGPKEPEPGAGATTFEGSKLSISTADGPKRGLALAGRAYARCTGFLPKGSKLRGAVSLQGEGEGKLEVWLRTDAEPAQVLSTIELSPRDKGPKPLDLEIPGDARIAMVEFRAGGLAKGARLTLTEPQLTAPIQPVVKSQLPPAQGMVLVVLGTVPKRALSPYGGSVVLPELSTLAAHGVVFEEHRATSTLASASVASMLTGLDAKQHGLTSPRAAMPRSIGMVQEVLRQAGIRTAMFSANPLTSPAFGFARGFDVVGTQTPLEDSSAASVFDKAIEFVQASKGSKFFVLVHARGAHPPWDVSAEEAKELPPSGYTGGLDPRRASEALARARRGPAHLRFSDADRTRALALAARALRNDDAGLGRLMAALRSAGRDDTTRVIVTGDAGTDEAQPIPYVDSETLDETALSLPLIYRRDKTAGTSRGTAPSTSADLAKTVIEAFSLSAPSAFGGDSLDSGVLARDEGTVRIASFGSRVSARVGVFTLGQGAHPQRFCWLLSDTSCATDVRTAMPLAYLFLARETAQRLRNADKEPYEPALVDPLTSAALRQWDGH
jgi:arylsulfatase A-like enzyme